MTPLPPLDPDVAATAPLRQGGCACGAFRFEARGEPLHVGLCHCMTCRRRHGAPFNPFATYAATQVRWQGPELRWRSGDKSVRVGCATCGAPIFWADDAGEVVELHLGSFDDIGTLAPQYEIWTLRREPWLPPLDVPQYERNRTGDED
jgi:hypothetical protein